VTAWPSGSPRPLASSLNVEPGRTVANLAIVGVGPDGAVALYNALGDTQLVVDVLGWFPAGAAPGGSQGGEDEEPPGGPGSTTSTPSRSTTTTRPPRSTTTTRPPRTTTTTTPRTTTTTTAPPPTTTTTTAPPPTTTTTTVPGDPPGPPTAVLATPGPASVVVTFGPPDADGGSPVRGYDVTCTAGPWGVDGSAGGPGSPITVSGLTAGATYTCAVTASNGAGSSPPAFAGPVTVPLDPPTVPVPPTGVVALALGHSAVVSFTPSAADGGSPITGYAATCSSSDGGSRHTGRGSASPLVVDHLSPHRHYTCRVVAINGVGESALSAPSGEITTG
jgi:hypothetical protein